MAGVFAFVVTLLSAWIIAWISTFIPMAAGFALAVWIFAAFLINAIVVWHVFKLNKAIAAFAGTMMFFIFLIGIISPLGIHAFGI